MITATDKQFEVDPYPDYTNCDGPLLGIYSVKASASFEVCKPFALIIAHDEEEVLDIALAEGITRIEDIVLMGYALPKYVDSTVVYLNSGEYLHENIKN